MSGGRGRRSAALAVLALVAVLAAGCGGSGGSPASTGAQAVRTTTFSLDDPAYRKAQEAAAARRAARTTPAAPAATVPDEPDGPATTETAAPVAAGPKRPRIVQRPIPFPAQRKQEMAAYSERHYGKATAALRDPKVIVEHYTETPDIDSTFNTFAPDTADPELGELPNVCAHFVVDADGTIYQLVSLKLRCRHTVGLNWTAIGIEQVGSSDQEILGRPAQMKAIVRLTRWLQCRYGIATKDVIGHSESLSSPYHKENVERLRKQTHGDMTKAMMRKYRSQLGAC